MVHRGDPLFQTTVSQITAICDLAQGLVCFEASSWIHSAVRVVARSLTSTVLVSTLLGILCVVPSISALQAAPRNSFPGRRVGGGTRGECAARPIVHLVPASSVFAPASTAVIGLLEGPSSDPQPLEVTLRTATADGKADAALAPVMTRQLSAAVNRLVLLSIPSGPRPLLWESSYRCGAASGGDEFGFITASAPPALSLLVQQGSPEDQQLQQQLVSLKASCGATTSLASIKAALQLGDQVFDQSWPQTITVECL